MTLTVGEWQVEKDANLLSREGLEVSLEPKAMEVFCYLIANAGQTVKREELESACWPGQIVGYDALSNAVIKIRKALGDNARSPQYLQTVTKTGYRLIAPVSSAKAQPITSKKNVHCAPPHRQRELSSKPVIVVLPLRWHAVTNTKQARLAGDVLAEEILYALSRHPEAVLISRRSSYQYRDEHDLEKICRELNADHIIDGSITDTESGIDVRVALNSCQQFPTVLWAERFTCTMDMPRHESKQVVSATVSAVTSALGLAQHSSVTRGTRDNLAYSHFLKGRELDRQDVPASNKAAREHFHKAITLDEHFSSAHSYLSRALAVCFINRWCGFHPDQLHESLGYADTAIALDAGNPHAHFAHAASILWLRNYAAAMQSAREAIRLAPSFTEAHAVKGMIYLYSGEPFKALKPLQKAMVLDPYFRDAYQHIQAQAYFHLGDYKSAEQLLLQRLLRKPESDTSRVLLAAAYGHLGNHDVALDQWRRAISVNPQFSLKHKRSILPYQNTEYFDQITGGLILAGIKPET